MDANNFSASGVLCVGLGMCYGMNHSTFEYLDVADFLCAGELAAKLVLAYGAEAERY